jgi:hypothetical protein
VKFNKVIDLTKECYFCSGNILCCVICKIGGCIGFCKTNEPLKSSTWNVAQRWTTYQFLRD